MLTQGDLRKVLCSGLTLGLQLSLTKPRNEQTTQEGRDMHRVVNTGSSSMTEQTMLQYSRLCMYIS